MAYSIANSCFIVFLVHRTFPLKSALYSAVSIIFFGSLNKASGQGLVAKNMPSSFCPGTKGLISGCFHMCSRKDSGWHYSLTELGMGAVMLIELSGGNIVIVSTMIVSIILGMGVPPVAAYAIAGSAIGPALVKLGIAPLAAHLFIFYFCAISVITPPVALASYAAAALAKADMWMVGITGFKMGIVGFLIPYMFVYNQVLLMQGETFPIIIAFVTGAMGAICMAAAFQGWYRNELTAALRLVLAVAAIGFIIAGTY